MILHGLSSKEGERRTACGLALGRCTYKKAEVRGRYENEVSFRDSERMLKMAKANVKRQSSKSMSPCRRCKATSEPSNILILASFPRIRACNNVCEEWSGVEQRAERSEVELGSREEMLSALCD